MTRSDDSFVPLETRTAMANEQESDLFISIHANSSRVRSVRGVETFFLNFTSSREALETASRENAASERSVHGAVPAIDAREHGHQRQERDHEHQQSPAPDDPWIAPAEARALRSPIAPGPDVAKRGRSLGAAGP